MSEIQTLHICKNYVITVESQKLKLSKDPGKSSIYREFEFSRNQLKTKKMM